MQFQLQNLNYNNSETFFSLFLFFFFFFHSIKNYFIRHKNSKTIIARNLKLGDMVSLYMKLRTCIFGGATSRSLVQTH